MALVIGEEDKGILLLHNELQRLIHVHVYMLYCSSNMTTPPTDIEEAEPVDNSPWAGTDRDYTYEEVYTVIIHVCSV